MASWWSRLLQHRSLVGCNRGNLLYICLSTTQFGFIALDVAHLGAFGPSQTNLFRVNPRNVEVLHVTDPSEWFVVPIQAVCPLECEMDWPACSDSGIIFKQVDAADIFLKHAFRFKTHTTNAELEQVAMEVGAPRPFSAERVILLTCICEKLCAADSPDVCAAYLQNALEDIFVFLMDVPPKRCP